MSEDFNDPFGFHDEDEDHHETPDEPTVEKEDAKDDARQPSPETASTTKRKSKSRTPPSKTTGVRDYGRTGVTAPDPVKMDELTTALSKHIQSMGTYEVLTCLANAFEKVGDDLAGNHKTTHRGYIYHDAAEIVDKIVDTLKGT